VILSKLFHVGLEGIDSDFVSSPKLTSSFHFNESVAGLILSPGAFLAVSSAKRRLASGFRIVCSIAAGSASPNGQFDLHCVLAHAAASDHAGWWFCALFSF